MFPYISLVVTEVKKKWYKTCVVVRWIVLENVRFSINRKVWTDSKRVTRVTSIFFQMFKPKVFLVAVVQDMFLYILSGKPGIHTSCKWQYLMFQHLQVRGRRPRNMRHTQVWQMTFQKTGTLHLLHLLMISRAVLQVNEMLLCRRVKGCGILSELVKVSASNFSHAAEPSLPVWCRLQTVTHECLTAQFYTAPPPL